MKDSDWENPANTQTVTTYSESALRANSNHLFRADVDVNISDWLGLPPGFEIRPLFAFQFQRFNLMSHDGTQWSVGNYDDAMAIDGPTDASSLNGDTIRFRQDYYMYHIGLKGSYDGFKINKYMTIKISGEADWGPALGYYKDHHLLRTGNLIAYCKSSGSSLYFATGVDMIIAKTITAGITMDYLWIRTTGVTRHTNFLMGEDLMWSDGVKTWSDQTSLMAHVSYAF
jgi:outer membrane protease